MYQLAQERRVPCDSGATQKWHDDGATSFSSQPGTKMTAWTVIIPPFSISIFSIQSELPSQSDYEHESMKTRSLKLVPNVKLASLIRFTGDYQHSPCLANLAPG